MEGSAKMIDGEVNCTVSLRHVDNAARLCGEPAQMGALRFFDVRAAVV